MAATEKQKANIIPPKKGEVRNPNGRPVGSKNTKTILERFLNLEMKQKNPFTQEIENMSVLELMNLKQIANALEGDLQAFREIIDRHEGKVSTKVESLNLNIDAGKLTDEEIKRINDNLETAY
jgi:hypothetical protein